MGERIFLIAAITFGIVVPLVFVLAVALFALR
jgi:hypothetical protein